MLPVPPVPDSEPAAAPAAPRPTAKFHYVLLEANSREALQETVNAYLHEGWRLQGGVAVATTGALHWWYYQAVVGP